MRAGCPIFPKMKIVSTEVKILTWRGCLYVAVKPHLAELQVYNRTVAGSWFNSRACTASLRTFERHFTLISYWNGTVFPFWWPSLTKDLQTEPPKRCSTLMWLLVRQNEELFERLFFQKIADNFFSWILLSVAQLLHVVLTRSKYGFNVMNAGCYVS